MGKKNIDLTDKVLKITELIEANSLDVEKLYELDAELATNIYSLQRKVQLALGGNIILLMLLAIHIIFW